MVKLLTTIKLANSKHEKHNIQPPMDIGQPSGLNVKAQFEKGQKAFHKRVLLATIERTNSFIWTSRP